MRRLLFIITFLAVLASCAARKTNVIRITDSTIIREKREIKADSLNISHDTSGSIKSDGTTVYYNTYNYGGKKLLDIRVKPSADTLRIKETVIDNTKQPTRIDKILNVLGYCFIGFIGAIVLFAVIKLITK